MRDFPRGFFRSSACGRLVVPAILGIVSGCTTIPAKEFASYKEAFKAARAAGEEVLVEYGASAKQYEDILEQRAAAKPKPKQRGEAFDPAAIARQGGSVDTIAVRMKAWDVVSRYNDLLTALAEGKAADDLLKAVDGLSSSLGGFPIAEVAATAVDVSEFLAPLRGLAQAAAREQSRRAFVAAVGKGSDLINQKFIKLLRDDAADFYRIRKGLNDLEFNPLVDGIANRTAKDFSDLAKTMQSTADVKSATAAFNAELVRLPQSRGKSPVEPVKDSTGAQAPTAAQVAELKRLVEQAKDQVARALAVDAALDAYRDVLSAYINLLGKLDQSTRDLQLAAESAQPVVPRGDELQRAVIVLREAYISYKAK